MADQLGLLPGVETPPDVHLTPRQRYALEVIGRLQPVESDELGAYLHEERAARGLKGHPADVRCDFCAGEGRSMGAALRAKGLVKQRRGVGWVLVSYVASSGLPTGDGYDPATSEIPF